MMKRTITLLALALTISIVPCRGVMVLWCTTSTTAIHTALCPFATGTIIALTVTIMAGVEVTTQERRGL